MSDILKRIAAAAMFKTIEDAHLHVETRPFLSRYLSKNQKALGALTPTDHYRHLIQLKAIYTALQNKMQTFHPELPVQLHWLLTRTNHIDADLRVLDKHVSVANRDIELPATKKYVALLNTLGNSEKASKELLAHFLTLTLGDLNGGAFLKHCIARMLKENEISGDALNTGVNFFPINTSAAISAIEKWLKQFIPFDESRGQDQSQQVDKECIIASGIIAAFKMQTQVVHELELTRDGKKILSHQHASFFNCLNMSKAIATTAAVTIAAAALYRLIN